MPQNGIVYELLAPSHVRTEWLCIVARCTFAKKNENKTFTSLTKFLSCIIWASWRCFWSLLHVCATREKSPSTDKEIARTKAAVDWSSNRYAQIWRNTSASSKRITREEEIARNGLRGCYAQRPEGVLSYFLLWLQHLDGLWRWDFELACELVEPWSLPFTCGGMLSPFCETGLLIWIGPISSSDCNVCTVLSISSLYPFSKKSEQFLRTPWSYGFLNLPLGPLR